MSALTNRQTGIKDDLLGKAMRRLNGALVNDKDPDYVAHVMHRFNFILGKLKTLPEDHHPEILEKMKESVETSCKDEALRSRLLATLGHSQAA